MAGRRHHYSCRCNDCVRQRNARRRLSAERYADEGNPLPSGSIWYEVPEDHPVRYADDTSPSAYRQQIPANDGDKDDTETPQEPLRPEQPIRYQRDDMEWELEQQMQEFRRQQEERQRDWERRREQLRTEPATSEIADTEEPGIDAMEPPSDDDGVPVSMEPAQPAAPVSITVTRRNAKGIMVPLIVSFLLIIVVAGIGLLLVYVMQSSSSETLAPEAVEPTRDLEATITAAVAAAINPAPTIPTPSTQPELGDASLAGPTVTTPEDERPSPNPPVTNAGPGTLPSDSLPTVECLGCTVPDPPANGYVEWVREPNVSEGGVLTFRARIDERAGFVVAGADCGNHNLTLTDDSNAFYGVIIPRNMANACTVLPGQRITDQYAYFSNLLIVRLQMEPGAALHPGLTLCLWKGGVTEELLDCVPVKQP